MVQSRTRIFALLVGIDDYPLPDHLKLQGCCTDADRYYRYLTGDRGVPACNIMVLKNKEATRNAIIQTFQAFLIDNKDIATGDALIFHFSGHGSQKPAPAGWPVAWKNDDNEAPVLEMIIPYDGVGDLLNVSSSYKARSRNTGIPDRTLASLLRKASEKHGNNITVTLDCCHSGSGTRKGMSEEQILNFRPRELDARYVGDLDVETDKAIWDDDDGDSEADAVPNSPTIAFASSRNCFLRAANMGGQHSTHVLMAACHRQQRANGSPTGGWFTAAWLDSLRDARIQPPTYANIHASISRKLDEFIKLYNMFPEEMRPDPQTPQCEGVNRDREVFRISRLDSREFRVSAVEDEPGWCEIEAGDMHNITPGTIFELRAYKDGSSTGQILGTAIAASVDWKSSRAKLPEGWEIELYHVRAFVTNLAKPLKFAIVNSKPNSSTSAMNLNRVQKCFSRPDVRSETSSGYTLVKEDEDPDLCLLVHEWGVNFQRRDPLMKALEVDPTSVHARYIEKVFPGVMGYLSRFNLLLAQDSPTHPFAEQVDLTLHTLKPLRENLDGEYEVDKEITFVHKDEATVDHAEDILYGVVLKNHTDVPLFVYVFWYDPSAYSIDLFYEPLNTSLYNAPLPAATEDGPGSLQIGGSPECMAAMSLVVKEDNKRDTGFLKIILSTEAVSVQFMQQAAVLGEDENGLPAFLTAKRGFEDEGGEAQPTNGQWDMLLRKITVLPRVY